MAEKVKKKGKILLVLAVLLLIMSSLGFLGVFYEMSIKSKAMERYEKYSVVNIDGDFLSSKDEIDEYFKEDISYMLIGTMVFFVPGIACVAGYVAKNKKS